RRTACIATGHAGDLNRAIEEQSQIMKFTDRSSRLRPARQLLAGLLAALALAGCTTGDAGSLLGAGPTSPPAATATPRELNPVSAPNGSTATAAGPTPGAGSAQAEAQAPTSVPVAQQATAIPPSNQPLS